MNKDMHIYYRKLVENYGGYIHDGDARLRSENTFTISITSRQDWQQLLAILLEEWGPGALIDIWTRYTGTGAVKYFFKWEKGGIDD